MLLKLLNGDTINGQKYKREGVLSLNYLKLKEEERLQRYLSRQEINPITGQLNTLAGVVSGVDPVGKFVVETVALSPLSRLFKARKLLKSTRGTIPKGKPRTVIGVDGNNYRLSSSVSDDALDRYLTDNMIYRPLTFKVPDIKLLELNILREKAWIPKGSTVKAKRLARRATDRTKKAEEVVKDSRVTTYKNILSMPKEELEKHNYFQIGDNVLGVHTKTGNYLNDPYSPDSASIALHEATHGYLELLPYTSQLSAALRNTYLLPKNVLFRDSRLVDEMGATNAEIRRKLFYQFGQPSFENFNLRIASMTEPEAFNIFETFRPNSYMTDYYNGIKVLPKKYIPTWLENFKLALMYVPVTTGLIINKNRK